MKHVLFAALRGAGMGMALNSVICLASSYWLKLRGPAQCLQHPRFRVCIQIGRDLIQQQHPGIRGRRAGNGQKLPFALRKHAVRAGRVIACREGPDGCVQPGQPRGLLGHFPADPGITQRDLIQHCARHPGKMLLHAANAAPPLLIGNPGNIHAADGDLALLGLIQAQQQPEHRALARACPANQRHLFPRLYRERQIRQHRAFPIAKGHMRQDHVPRGVSPAADTLGVSRSGCARNASMRFTPAMADWMV